MAEEKKILPPGMVITGRVDSVNSYQGKDKTYWSVDINAPLSGTVTIKLPEGASHEYEIDERYSIPVKFRMAQFNGKAPFPEYTATANGTRR